MTKLIKILKYTLSGVITSLFLVSFSAHSSHIKCVDSDDGDYAYLVDAFTNELDCELGLTGNDTGQGDVNAPHDDGHGMFGIDDWILLEEHVDIDSGISPNNFSIDPNYFSSYNTFMLTFKSATNADPDKYIGYLLDVVNFSMFNWIDAMFQKTSGDEGYNEISHINLYGFDDDGVVIITCTTSTPCTDIPEPNLLFIFGLGLIGLYIRNRMFKLSRVVC